MLTVAPPVARGSRGSVGQWVQHRDAAAPARVYVGTRAPRPLRSARTPTSDPLRDSPIESRDASRMVVLHVLHGSAKSARRGARSASEPERVSEGNAGG